MKRFLKDIDKQPIEITREDLRRYLRSLEKYSSASCKNALMAMPLKLEDINFEKLIITPNNHLGETKKSWVCFYNLEAELALRAGLNVTPQKLRQWFCSEMLRLSVPET
jgi:hypothetical protein